MSRIAPNFGRTVTSEPENVAGLRRGAIGLLVLSILILFLYWPAGLVGILSSLVWLLASMGATVTTNIMEISIESGDKGGGCLWYAATLFIGLVAFMSILGLALAAMAGQ